MALLEQELLEVLVVLPELLLPSLFYRILTLDCGSLRSVMQEVPVEHRVPLGQASLLMVAAHSRGEVPEEDLEVFPEILQQQGVPYQDPG